MQCFRGKCCKSLELPGLNPRNELGITKALVIPRIAEELGGIIEERLDFCLRETGFRGCLLPVAVAVVVQGNDEVVDVLGLRADLSKDNSRTGEASSETVKLACYFQCLHIRNIHRDVVGVELLFLVQCFKVGLDGQRDNCWRAVCQVMGEYVVVHGFSFRSEWYGSRWRSEGS